MLKIKLVFLKLFFLLYIYMVVLLGVVIHNALPDYFKLVGGGLFIYLAFIFGGVSFTEKIEDLESLLTKRAPDAPKPFVNHCIPVNGVHAPFCNGDHSARG